LHVEKYANEAETSLELFEAVSVFCFSIILDCATNLNSEIQYKDVFVNVYV